MTFKDIIVNLYKLHFSYSLFSLQPNKFFFHPPTFPPLQPNTHEGKPNLFYPPTFQYPLTKRTLSPIQLIQFNWVEFSSLWCIGSHLVHLVRFCALTKGKMGLAQVLKHLSIMPQSQGLINIKQPNLQIDSGIDRI